MYRFYIWTLVVVTLVTIVVIYFIADHVRLKAIATGLAIGKTHQVDALVQTEQECDLNWYIYLIMGLIMGIAYWLILDKIKTVKSL